MLSANRPESFCSCAHRPTSARRPALRSLAVFLPQFGHIELIPQNALVNQVPVPIKKDALTLEQFPFRLLILPTWNLLPITLKAADKLFFVQRQHVELMVIAVFNTLQ